MKNLFCFVHKSEIIQFRLIAKANAFIYGIVMNPRNGNKIEDLIGIRFTSLNYSTGDSKLEELKKKMRTFLEELERI